MKIDTYTKILLTIIATGIIGINIYLFNFTLVDNAYASNNKSIEAFSGGDAVYLVTNDGKKVCRFWRDSVSTKKWSNTGC